MGRHAHYSDDYSVNDARSGDLKVRQETRDGDVVQGSYTMAGPDGLIRHDPSGSYYTMRRYHAPI